MGKELTNRGREGVAAERRVQAFQLYKSGWTFRQIATKFGVSHTCISKDIHGELDALAAERREVAKEVLELELQRMDDLLKVLTPRALRGDDQAIDRMLKVIERRAKYLGLDKPMKVEGTFQLEDLVARSQDPKEAGNG